MTQRGKELMAELARGMDDLLPEKGERQILLAALDVFARLGLAGAKISDIAKKAGFSQGFVYNYFKSKDAIFTRLVSLAADGAGETARKAAELPGTPYERIYWLTEALLSPESIAMKHWRLIMLQAATSEAVPAEATKVAREKAGLPFLHMVPLIEEGQRLGELRQGDALMLAITYFSFVQGLGIARIQTGDRIPFPPIELVLSFLRTPGRAETPGETKTGEE
jgi:AcrR family transcriptional regulator